MKTQNVTRAVNEIRTFFKTPRVRSRRHLDWIATLPCVIPGCTRYRETVVPHHLTCGPEPKARSLKASDHFTLPLCHRHHGPGFPGSLHDRGDERAWWRERDLDPIVMTAWLAFHSRCLGILK